MARIVLEHQGHTSEHRVTGLTTIGRQSTNDIMVLAEKASRQHARIVLVGGRFVLEDAGSANGTLLNGVRVESHVLAHRDEIRIGDAKLTFYDDRSANLEGQTLGNYRIHNRIGQGTMGAVYKATQISMDRIVALKVLREDLVADREFVRAFLSEARTAGKLNHPNVVRVHDFGEAGGVYYFSMEFVNGQTVENVLKRDGKVPVRQALEMARQVAEALRHAHGLGILHGDVKPRNIMVDRRGQVKLTDMGFGQAGRAGTGGTLAGTPHYMAPELARGGQPDQRSDLYSFGASLYHMVAGRVPFDAPDARAIVDKHVNEPLTSPRKLDPGIPGEVSDLIELLMAKNPGLRPASAGDLVKRIEDVLQKGPKEPAAKDDELKIAPPAPPKSKAPEKRPPSVRKPAPEGAAPAGAPRGVRVIKVSAGSPVAFMLIGAFLVAIVGIVIWVVVTKRPQRTGGTGHRQGPGYVDPNAMGDAEAERKLDEARRARDRGDHAAAYELAHVVAARSTSRRLVREALGVIAELSVGGGRGDGTSPAELEAEAARQLEDVRTRIEENPQGLDYHARQLLLLIRNYRGTAAAAEAAKLYREIWKDEIPPEVEEILRGAAVRRTEAVAVAPRADPDPGDAETPAGEAKVPAAEAFQKASAASASAEEKGDLHRARAALVRFAEAYPGSPESTQAAELLDRLDRRIRERMRGIYERATALSGQSKYAEAEKLLREIIDRDPVGDDRELATVLLEANDAAGRRAYAAVLEKARPDLDGHRFEAASRVMRAGASKLAGTQWGGELEAAAESAGMSAALIERFGKKLEGSKGRAPQVKISVGGEPASVALVGATPKGLALSRRGVRMVVPWKDLSTEDVLRVFRILPVDAEDRLGLGAFLFLRGDRKAARRELDQARHHPATREKALALLGQLDARAKVRRLDFSSFEHFDSLRLDGDWRLRDGRLTYDGSRVGAATLRGVDYRADGFRLSFEVEFLEDVGAVEAQLGSSAEKCVWFSLGSEGYQARMQSGDSASDVQGDWNLVTGKPLAISCRIDGDRLSVEAGGKALKALEAKGLGELAGPVVFRAQGARLALDNIVTRQSGPDAE